MVMDKRLSRREFIKLATLGVGGTVLRPLLKVLPAADFPQAERLGRVAKGWVDLKARPDYDSPTIGTLYEDTVVVWLREVAGYWPYRNNQRWVETPDGYVWCAYLQPVRNQPVQPVAELPQLSDGQRGMWAEVSIPYVDAVLANGPPRSAWWRYRQENGLPFRFYYSQVVWIDAMKTDDDGATWYRVNERYGNPGDIFWCRAEAFRQITADEMTPISPEVEDKRIEVNIGWNDQFLSCFEGSTEVYYCRISSGVGENATPTTPPVSPGFMIWRKLFSLHMGGSTAAGSWDVPAVGWTSLFQGDGVAIHSTYWHNNYGEPMSHGCLNARPDDAKWIFRWTSPVVPFEEGDITIVGSGGTRVIVREL